MLLVGDNAFHGVSHLTRWRARSRRHPVLDPVQTMVVLFVLLSWDR